MGVKFWGKSRNFNTAGEKCSNKTETVDYLQGENLDYTYFFAYEIIMA